MGITNLILLNGPPAVGKSTLARRYVDEHPLTLNVDIDGLRRALGEWEAHEESKTLARRLALALVREHLATGHDVVVPQLLGRTEFIDDLAAVAREAGAAFHEFVILDIDTAIVQRFLVRRAELAEGGERHPEVAIEQGREAEVIADVSRALRDLARRRPATHVIEGIDGAYESVCGVLSAAKG